jgi:hypothetical protein
MTGPFDERLRNELMAAVHRRPRRRRRHVAVAAVALAIGGLLAASLVADQRPASADVEITHEDGRVIVRLTDLANTADEIEAAIDAEGLDVRVEAVAAGPSHVGRFVGEVGDADIDDVERSEVDGVSFMAFSIPEDWDGTLTVLLGRPAGPDEPYVSSTDAFAPGEPLACSSALGMPLRSVVERLKGFDVTVLVFEDAQSLPQMSLSEAIESGHGDDPITGAAGVSSSKVVIDVGRSLPPKASRPC